MRFLPHTEEDRKEMLKSVGVDSIAGLYEDVPEESRFNGEFNLPDTQGEIEVERFLANLANQNHSASKGPFFLGAGCYYHHIPAVADHVVQRSEYLTAYTPYQPEISQGTLAVVFQFQSMIAKLTGMDVANASMYDGATSVTEAALMSKRITKRNKITVIGELHPHYRSTMETYFKHIDLEIDNSGEINSETACVIIQTPDFHGNISELAELRAKCDEAGALLVVAVTEILSLGLLDAPSCADIVAGEAQSIGVPMQYGGPHLGFFACKQKYVRQMPGRLCGETTDAEGKRAFVLTLNTREQHIRREKATSNICTNQGLCATAFTVHLSLLGEIGFKHLAQLNHERACDLADALEEIEGVKVINETFFNEFVVQLPKDSNEINETLIAQGITPGLPLEGNKMLVAATEMSTESDIKAYAEALAKLVG